MDRTQNSIACAIGCWLAGLVVAIIALGLLMVLGDWTFMQALFAGVIIFAIVGALLSWILCKPLPAPNEATLESMGAKPVSGTTTAAPEVKSAAPAAKAAPKTDAPVAPKAEPAAAPAPAAASSESTGAAAAGGVAASATLKGEEELAERKGSWSYDGGNDASPAAKPATDAAPSAAASEPASDAAGIPDFDGDGVLEGTDEGTKPTVLSGPRDGKPDNLKEIKGIGPKLEAAVNDIGVYHFDQIAAWTADEVAWVNANLIGFKGRVSRDNWVEQAKILAAGGETEFSKRVEKGGVYD